MEKEPYPLSEQGRVELSKELVPSDQILDILVGAVDKRMASS
jgi:hypothetical protein